jgi:quercetin dioxygenase-like cupin family protein
MPSPFAELTNGTTPHLDAPALKAIAHRLSVPEEALLKISTDLEEGTRIARRGETYTRTAQRDGIPYYTYEHLVTTKTAPSFMALRISVLAHKESNIVMNSHEAPEFVYVTRGIVRYNWGRSTPSNETILNIGDSVYISPGTPHSFTAVDDNPEIIAVNL